MMKNLGLKWRGELGWSANLKRNNLHSVLASFSFGSNSANVRVSLTICYLQRLGTRKNIFLFYLYLIRYIIRLYLFLGYSLLIRMMMVDSVVQNQCNEKMLKQIYEWIYRLRGFWLNVEIKHTGTLKWTMTSSMLDSRWQHLKLLFSFMVMSVRINLFILLVDMFRSRVPSRHLLLIHHAYVHSLHLVHDT